MLMKDHKLLHLENSIQVNHNLFLSIEAKQTVNTLI